MSAVPLWIATVLYLAQAAICAAAFKYPQALILGSYAAANLGLIWSMQ